MSRLEARHRGLLAVDIYSRTGEISLDQKVLQPYRHIANHVNGGNLRLLTNAYNYWFKNTGEQMAEIEEIFRIVYNATLLFDDIEDRSILRRGSPVAHSIYGAPSTLVASNYAFSIALDRILDFIESDNSLQQTTRLVTEVIVEVFRGQGLEIYWRENFICPTLEEYCNMCAMKSSGLFKLVSTLMSSASTARKEDFSKLNELLAIAFQIGNDYENLASEHCFKRKTFCEDITEGKYSYPIIHAIQNHPKGQEIMEILRLNTTDDKLKRRCLSLIKEAGSLQITKKKVTDVREEIIQEAKRFGNNPQMDIFIAFVLGERE